MVVVVVVVAIVAIVIVMVVVDVAGFGKLGIWLRARIYNCMPSL